jgi:hypothetical protein
MLIDGLGVPVGVAKSLDGRPAIDRAKIRRKITATLITHGAARRSIRGGRLPR